MRLEDAFAAWAAAHARRSPGTVARYRTALRALVRFGITTTDEADAPRVAAFMDTRIAEGVSTPGANLEVVALVTVLRHAARREPALLERIAAIGALRLPAPCPPPPEVYSPAEWERVRAVAERITDWLPLAIELTAWAGLRRNEARTLHGEDVDLGARVLVVVRRRDRELKTRVGSQRTVSLAPRLIEVLRAADLPERGPVFPARKRDARTPYVSLEVWKRAMRLLSRESGVHATWGRARRSWITWGMRSGIPQVVMQRMAGHADGRQIERHYFGWRAGYDPAIELLRPSG